MKTQYCIIGIHGRVAHFFTGKDFVAHGWDLAKRWNTFQGAGKAVLAMEEAGSDWPLAVVEAPTSAASALGKLALGKPKTITPAESAARSERMKAARAKRWKN